MKQLFLVLALLAPLAFAQSSNLQKGDSYYALRAENSKNNMANDKNVKEAIKYYALALKTPSEREEAAWKLLRAYYFQGCFSMPSAKEREIFFKKARDDGKSFWKEFPENPQIAYWYSVNMALWAVEVNPLTAWYAGSLGETKKVAQMLIEQEKKGDKVSAARGSQILGRAHQKIPHLKFVLDWVKRDSAEFYYKKSMNLNPDDLATRLFFAEYYKETSKVQDARALQAPVLKLKPRPEEYLEDERNLIRIRELF